MVAGLLEILRQLHAGRADVGNVYTAVRAAGNDAAAAVVDEVMEPCDARWRALGTIPQSGLRPRAAFARYDAMRRFDLHEGESYELPGCRCGLVITGRSTPAECPLFGRQCTPREPVGPCMVSSEGACAAWYKYHRR
jgi:hydrogenase expression/formation protein HypD